MFEAARARSASRPQHAPEAKPVRRAPAAAAHTLQQTIGNQGVQQLLRNAEHPVDWNPRAASGDSGQSLSAAAREPLERQFGRDLGGVRLHTESALGGAIGAKAFASGHDIWFAPGHGPDDRDLLAHEVAHVVEQARAGSANVTQFDFESDVLAELRRLPSAEEEGISEPERIRRQGVIDARRERLRELFRKPYGIEADRLLDRLRRRVPGDALSEAFHGILHRATRRELLEILEDSLRDSPPESANFCVPYTANELRVLRDFDDLKGMTEFVDDWIALAFGEETADLFREFLTRTPGDSMTPQVFDDPAHPIVRGFAEDKATKRRQEELLTAFGNALVGSCPMLPPDMWVEVDIASVLPAKTLEQSFSFFYGVPTLAGILAGGVSPTQDTRRVSGKIEMRRTVSNGSTTNVQMRTKLRFDIGEVLDFCPGNIGGWAGSITIPMSRLEASGFAHDVPFEVHYDAPTIERDLSVMARIACFGV